MYLTSLGEAFMGLDLWLHVHVSFPQSSAEERGVCLVLSFCLHIDAQVPFAPRGPGARANVCDSDASTPAHLNLQDTWRAWARRDRVAVAAKAARCNGWRSRRTWFGGVGSSSGWTWVWKLYFSFATGLLLLLRYICNRTATPWTAVTTDGTGHSPDTLQQHTCLPTPLASTHKEDLPRLALTSR
jgi:hypothetical protein